jgi:hypothetical protein
MNAAIHTTQVLALRDEPQLARPSRPRLSDRALLMVKSVGLVGAALIAIGARLPAPWPRRIESSLTGISVRCPVRWGWKVSYFGGIELREQLEGARASRAGPMIVERFTRDDFARAYGGAQLAERGVSIGTMRIAGRAGVLCVFQVGGAWCAQLVAPGDDTLVACLSAPTERDLRRAWPGEPQATP